MEGRKDGRKEGRQEGRKEGRKEGREKLCLPFFGREVKHAI
jgi:predicted transposase YdaD